MARRDTGEPNSDLQTAVKMWPTPAARDIKGANGAAHLENGTGRLHLDQLPNFVQFIWKGMDSSRPDLTTSTVGGESSPSRRSLNPLFVEWLMGWPRGWTMLALSMAGSNAFACSATELSVWKQRMRSAFLQLGLPPAAPAVQLGLFG